MTGHEIGLKIRVSLVRFRPWAPPFPLTALSFLLRVILPLQKV
jgi:hypothetical protein